jgi:hypothetical protein
MTQEFKEIEHFFGSGPGWFKIGDREIKNGDHLELQWGDEDITKGIAIVSIESWGPQPVDFTTTSIGRTDIKVKTDEGTYVRPFKFKARFCNKQDKKNIRWAIEETIKLRDKIEEHLSKLYSIEARIGKQ